MLISRTSSTTSPPIVTNYVNYTNTNYGVSIQYPSNWIKNETQQGQNYAEFYSLKQMKRTLIWQNYD